MHIRNGNILAIESTISIYCLIVILTIELSGVFFLPSSAKKEVVITPIYLGPANENCIFCKPLNTAFKALQTETSCK